MKFTLVSSVRAIEQKQYNKADYSVCWLMDYFLRFQFIFCTTEDFEKYFLRIKESGFDFDKEFAKIRHTFVTVVIEDHVIAKKGLFYYGDDTPQNPCS